jgi:hypothetical protein
MSGKDVLKLLLIAFGFTKVNIRTYRGDYNYIGYEIHATGDDGIYYDEENCEGLMFNITNIIETMKDRGIDAKYGVFGGGDYSVGEVLNMVDGEADTKDTVHYN